MSTRSNIIRENRDGSMDVIYCHWDGYPSNNGRILLQHYYSPEKVDALIALGNLSVLGEELGEKHDFSIPGPDNTCTAYGRDRGEKDVAAKHYKSKAGLSRYLKGAWTEWVYLYRVSEQKWYYTNNPSPTWFKCCGTEQRSVDELTVAATEPTAA